MPPLAATLRGRGRPAWRMSRVAAESAPKLTCAWVPCSAICIFCALLFDNPVGMFKQLGKSNLANLAKFPKHRIAIELHHLLATENQQLTREIRRPFSGRLNL